MKIQNSQTKVSETIELNDKDYMNRLLSSLKEMVKGYALVLTEASNENIVKDYQESLLEYIKLQRDTFELMFQNGWYLLESVDNKKINNELTTLEKEFMTLCNE